MLKVKSAVLLSIFIDFWDWDSRKVKNISVRNKQYDGQLAKYFVKGRGLEPSAKQKFQLEVARITQPLKITPQWVRALSSLNLVPLNASPMISKL